MSDLLGSHITVPTGEGWETPGLNACVKDGCKEKKKGVSFSKLGLISILGALDFSASLLSIILFTKRYLTSPWFILKHHIRPKSLIFGDKKQSCYENNNNNNE